jgi:hypothetical protein
VETCTGLHTTSHACENGNVIRNAGAVGRGQRTRSECTVRVRPSASQVCVEMRVYGWVGPTFTHVDPVHRHQLLSMPST